MSARLIFRLVTGVLLTTYLFRKAMNLSYYLTREYFEFTKKSLDDTSMLETQEHLFQAQQITDLLVFLLVIPLFYHFVLKRLDARRQWWLALPIAALLAVLIGFPLAYLDAAINDYYFLIFVSKPESSAQGFLNLQILNSLLILTGLFISGFLFRLEQFIFEERHKIWQKLRSIGAPFWLSIFSLSLVLGTLIIFYPTLYSLASVAGVLPQILLIPFFVSFISALFLEEFYSEGRVQFSKPANKLARILFPALGSLSLLGISLLWTWGFHPNLAGTYTYFFLITVALVASAGLLTFLAYLLNLGNIRRVLSLTADLQKSSSELDLLKSQINPHFLFNSLNTLYGIALEEEGLKTADGIQKLSDMMRFMLEENTTDKIPLSREIDYIHNYIDLQSLRLARSNDMALNINIDEACEGEITPMLIIPFIENAFKHGISLQQESWIKIHLSCSSQALNLTIKNTNHAKKDSMTKESGIGIENVRKRLAILYPNAHTLDIQSNEKVYEVLLKLPLT